MRAALLEYAGGPLRLVEMPPPEAGYGALQIKVEACGVCRTDVHLIDGELPDCRLPMTPGHQIVGRVSRLGPGTDGFHIGQRVGVTWLGWTCGHCRHCLSGNENLCDQARFTGCHISGGFAEYTVADAAYVFPLPESTDAAQLAPLLCAGLIGYRALRLAGDATCVGLYGFGSAAHILAQVLHEQRREFLAFTRPGDTSAQAFARSLGAAWAGGSDESPPSSLDAAIIFAAEGFLVPLALKHVQKGGRVVCAGIHMSDIPAFPYADLWGERAIMSVANLTRRDGDEFLALAQRIEIKTHIHRYPLAQANEAIQALREGRVTGSAVLVMA